MRSEAVNLLRFFQIPKKCIIPIYQRTYSWTEEQCDLLWEDILRVGTNVNVSNHFVGSFVYVQDGNLQVATATPEYMIIDGQQRMTTISLILLAISDNLKETKKTIELSDDFSISADYIKNNYLLNSNEDGNRKYKLFLTKSDKETYRALLDGIPLPDDKSKRIIENYEFFQDKLSEVKLTDVYKGLQKLMLVEIALDRTNDNPQLIFESLNSTGLELSQADLIRNYVLMSLEPEKQKRLYEQYWYPMEKRFGHAEYSSYFDRFMRDYLTTRLGRIPNINEVHKEFKILSQMEGSEEIEVLVDDIAKYSEYFVKMTLGKENDKKLYSSFENLNQLKIDVAYPFLLQVYKDWKERKISQDEFIEIIETIESYVFRRSICGIPTPSLSKTFANLYKEVDHNHYLESFFAALLLKDSYRRFPTDDEFSRELAFKDVYNFRNKNYLLSKIENSRHGKEKVEISNLSIEHIMPQNEDLSKAWKDELGFDWKNIQKKYIHTIGNLTLTGYNSELSDKPFQYKKTIKGGFNDSPLFLNTFLKNVEKWDENNIIERSKILTNISAEIWKFPVLEKSKLDTYKNKKKTKNIESEYTIENYNHLVGDKLKLFESTRLGIKNIHPNVVEDFKKFYIAYKIYDSNFVCIVPQATRLRLTLHIDFSDLSDPREISIDVKGKGRWGGGSIQFAIYNIDEIEYAIQLIKQSFDYVQSE